MMVVCFQMNSAKISACTKLELYYNIKNVVHKFWTCILLSMDCIRSERFFNLSSFDSVVQKCCPSKIKGRATQNKMVASEMCK